MNRISGSRGVFGHRTCEYIIECEKYSGIQKNSEKNIRNFLTIPIFTSLVEAFSRAVLYVKNHIIMRVVTVGTPWFIPRTTERSAQMRYPRSRIGGSGSMGGNPNQSDTVKVGCRFCLQGGGGVRKILIQISEIFLLGVQPTDCRVPTRAMEIGREKLNRCCCACVARNGLLLKGDFNHAKSSVQSL